MSFVFDSNHGIMVKPCIGPIEGGPCRAGRCGGAAQLKYRVGSALELKIQVELSSMFMFFDFLVLTMI